MGLAEEGEKKEVVLAATESHEKLQTSCDGFSLSPALFSVNG